MSQRPTDAIARRLERTAVVIRFAVGRPDSLGVIASVAVSYLVGYLWLTDLLAIRRGVGFDWLVVDDPVVRLFDRRGPLSFEPVALLDLGVGRVLVAPIDIGLGALLAALVGINLGLAYLALVQPRACGIGAGTGVAAAIPALFSGTACCAPVIVLALGIQIGATTLTVIPWLLPLGVVSLLGSLVYVAGLVSPES